MYYSFNDLKTQCPDAFLKKSKGEEGRKEGKEDLLTKLIFGIISSDLYSKRIIEKRIQMIYEMQTKI